METQVKVFGRCISFLLVLWWIFSAPRSANAHPIVQFWENETGNHTGLLFEPRVSYYSTSANYNSSAQATPIANSTTVSRMYYDLKLSLAVSEDFFIFGRGTVLSSKVKSATAADRSVTGLGDQMLGMAFRLVPPSNGFGFNLQFNATLPAYANPATPSQAPNNDPYKGDGSIDLTSGAFIEIPLASAWKIEAGAAYTYRSKGYSSAIPWSLMIKHTPESEGLILAAGLKGQMSMSTDKTSLTTVTNDQNAGAGGSYLISALNPGWIMPQAELGFKNGSGQSFYALAAFPMAGSDAPKGILIAGGIQFDFGAESHSSHSAVENTDEAERPRRATAPPAPTKSAAPVHKKKLAKASQFTTYDMEANVSSVNDTFYVIKIDKGSSDNVEKGQTFDIFHVTQNPITTQKDEKLIARATVSRLKDNEAALNVLEYYVDQWIEEGFTARRAVK